MNSSMSAPAANASAPAPRSTMQRSASSAERSFITRASSRHIAIVSAFNLPELLSTTVAMSPSRVTSMDDKGRVSERPIVRWRAARPLAQVIQYDQRAGADRDRKQQIAAEYVISAEREHASEQAVPGEAGREQSARNHHNAHYEAGNHRVRDAGHPAKELAVDRDAAGEQYTQRARRISAERRQQ